MWQCLQQKQELWKMSLSATSRSMGYTVFWQAVQVSFTWARRLKDCFGRDPIRGLTSDQPALPHTPASGPYLGALNRAAATATFGFLRERAGGAGSAEEGPRPSPAQIPGTVRRRGRETGKHAAQHAFTLRPDTCGNGVPSHPAEHLRGRGWPGWLLQPGTWLTGGDGGPVWSRGTRWVLQGEVG